MKPIAAALTCLCCLVAGACTVPSPFGPSAAEVLGRPAHAHLVDARFTMRGVAGTGAAAAKVQGAGEVVFGPPPAVRMTQTTLTGAAPVTVEIVAAGGGVYQRVGSARWAPAAAGLPVGVFSPWSAAADPRSAGDETVDGSRCWHVTARSGGAPLDLWVRQTDGYPIRARVGLLVIDYSHFNQSVRIAEPPRSEIGPPARAVTAGVGEVAHLDGVDVEVAGARLRYQPPAPATRPAPGSRLVVAEIVYTSTGPGRVPYGPFEWTLTDARDVSYDVGVPQGLARLGSGELTAAGAGARGFIAFLVPTASTGLTLRAELGADTVTVALG